MQVSQKKKSPIPGETVAAYARRTQSIGTLSTRGAEVLSSGEWKRVPLTHILKAGESVRPVQSASHDGDPMGLISLVKTLIRSQKK
jgi:hypothetical protein